MMNLNQHKGIKWVVLILFAFVFLTPSTFAKDEDTKSKDDTEKTEDVCADKFKEDQDVISVYGITLQESKNSPNKFTMSMNPESSDTEKVKKRRDVMFNITGRVGATITSANKVLGYKKPLTVQITNLKEFSLSFSGTLKDGDCTGTINFKYSGAAQGDSIGFKDDDVIHFSPTPPLVKRSIIKCENINSYAKDSFEREFCKAKIAAQKSKVYSKSGDPMVNFKGLFNNDKKFSDIVGGTNKFDNSNTKYSSFRCDYKKIYSPGELKDNYYVPENTSYLFGSGVSTEKDTYVYNYAPGNKVTESVSCKLECEEAVTVEYGPPVASKAGLCFEYKIRVTSRVSCELAEKIEPPKTPTKYCTPTPYCLNSSGAVYKQGGPNEDFDQCVQACDGGKYTDKCSNKCYKEVYGTSSSLLNYSDKELVAQKIANNSVDVSTAAGCKEHTTYKDGCYTVSGNTINWYTSGSHSRWHNFNRWGLNHPYPRTINGIPRGATCTDVCYWLWDKCSKNDYLNPGIAKFDQEKNVQVYNNLVAKCEAKASCNTSTAEFTIAVDYIHDTKDKKNETTTITFPYSTKKDKLTSKGKGNENVVNPKPEDDEESSILKYAGCYDDGSVKDWYRTEWSFPGSWINNKTGEVSYKKVGTGSGWKTMNEKFCIPLDAKDVNKNWWNYYYAKVLNLNNTSVGPTTVYDDKCRPLSGSNAVTNAAPSNRISVDKWNITGRTVKFGYFNWNLKIQCFYALNTNPGNIPNEPPECGGEEPNYRIRSVDLENLFPATDGTDLNNNPKKSGRAPGFNWTDYANNNKNDQFISYPNKYMQQVQSKGYSIYSEDSLDYEFELTPEILRKMRKTTKDGNYTAFSGDSSIGKNGVVHYISKAIHRGELKSAATNIPEESNPAILCNNMVSHDSTQCMSHDAG